jgi:transcriptional regulator with XRE-family HTH domain
MASITDRSRQRSTPKQRRERVGAYQRQKAQEPRVSRRRLKRLSREERRAYRRQLAQKAGVSRRRIKQILRQLPKPAHAVFDSLEPAFTHPTYSRLVLLALAAILTVGGRTICNLLRCLGALAPGHWSSYHRVGSHRRWRSLRLARRYITAVLDRFAPRGPVEVAGDDTVTEHPGPKVYGKGCHRDPVRSTRSFTAFRWGHKWVGLALLVRNPFCRRRWALPLMVALYRPPAEQGQPQKEGQAQPQNDQGQTQRSHKTPADLLGQMLRILIRWFPDRTFVCCADGNYATHELAELAAANPQRLKFVSKFYEDANLFESPPPYVKGLSHGRPRVKGKELPDPAQVVRETVKRSVLEVDWYGGERRRVEIVTGSGWWYKSGRPLVPVRWVFVHDLTGTHRDEYFFTTDPAMRVQVVIETYTGRWNIETTYQELRSYLGLETTRGWSRNTVLRSGPCLFSLDTVVVWLYVELPARYTRVRVVDWLGKRDVTFSDAITAVRRWLWVEWIFAMAGHREAFQKLSGPMRQLLLNGLAPAA